MWNTKHLNFKIARSFSGHGHWSTEFCPSVSWWMEQTVQTDGWRNSPPLNGSKRISTNSNGHQRISTDFDAHRRTPAVSIGVHRNPLRSVEGGLFRRPSVRCVHRHTHGYTCPADQYPWPLFSTSSWTPYTKFEKKCTTSPLFTNKLKINSPLSILTVGTYCLFTAQFCTWAKYWNSM